MLELAADLRLLDEAVEQVGPLAMPIQEHLQRQVAAQAGVAGPQDGAHAAAGDLAEELVPAGGAVERDGGGGGEGDGHAVVQVGLGERHAGEGRERVGGVVVRPVVAARRQRGEAGGEVGVGEARQAPAGGRAGRERGQALRHHRRRWPRGAGPRSPRRPSAARG